MTLFPCFVCTVRITERCRDYTAWVDSNEGEKRNDEWREKERAGKRGGPGRKMWVDLLDVSLRKEPSSTATVRNRQHISILKEGTGSVYSGRVGRMPHLWCSEPAWVISNQNICFMVCECVAGREEEEIMGLLWQFSIVVFSSMWPIYFSHTMCERVYILSSSLF